MITLASTTKNAFLNKFDLGLLPKWHAINSAQVSSVTISVKNLNALMAMVPGFAMLKVRMVEKNGQVYPLFNLTDINKVDLIDHYYDLNSSYHAPEQIATADYDGYVLAFNNGQLKAAMLTEADEATQAIFAPVDELNNYLYNSTAISEDDFVDIKLEYNQIDLNAPLLNIIPTNDLNRILGKAGYLNIIFTSLDSNNSPIVTCSYNVNHLCPPGCE